jgi:hypothetical protein
MGKKAGSQQGTNNWKRIMLKLWSESLMSQITKTDAK